jgi:hypothetical protein
MNRQIAIAFAVIGATSWYWPGFNGVFFSPTDISAGDGRIIAAIFLVGAAVVWFIRSPPQT